MDPRLSESSLLLFYSINLKMENKFMNIPLVDEYMISSLLDMSNYYDSLSNSEKRPNLYLVRLTRKNRERLYVYYNYIGYYPIFQKSLLYYY